MNIWILNHHALTPRMGGGTRHYDLGKALVKKGHRVTIIASSFHYSQYREMKVYEGTSYIRENVEGVDFIWIKTPPYFGNGFERVKNMFAYTMNVLHIIPSLHLERPDIIIGSSVHLFAVYAAYRLSRRYHTPFVMEVRDIWPRTLIDMGISKWHPFILLLSGLEKFLYKKADCIITLLPYAHEHIGRFVPQEKIVWISNGVDMAAIPYKMKPPSETCVVTYIGAIGMANNLEVFVQAAEQLKEHREVFFRIIGEGVQKAALQKMVEERDLGNVSIENAVPKQEVGEILAESDVLYLGLKDMPLYRFGMSMNKLYDYMAAGRMIVFAADTRNNPVKDANAGITVPPDDATALSKAILEACRLTPEQRFRTGSRARAYVQKHYDIEILAQRLENVLKKILEKSHV